MNATRTSTFLDGLKRGALFGARASLAIFGGVFLAVYGASGAWLAWVRLTRGAAAAGMLIDAEGGLRSLKAEVWMAAGRVLWLTACCTLLSATIFAIAALLSERADSDTVVGTPHPLDP